ncbi:glycosyl transferase, partial [Candidatus Pacearchaeota archaeon]|nr:glycosyl transferase [Candidatus Pacearchaeota archaeon]
CKDSGGPLEFVTHNETGLIANPNPESIARNLKILINNKKKAKNMGEKGFEKIKNINWKETILKIISNS